MRVTMFKERFKDLILAGKKCTTIRPRGKHRPQPGEARSLRVWTGRPYRSPQAVFATVVLREVVDVEITEDGPLVDGIQLTGMERNRFAWDDGFEAWEDLLEWFQAREERLPFEGYLLRWDPIQEQREALTRGGE